MQICENVLRLFRQMYTIRAVESYIIKHYHEDEMKTPMHMSYGQEHIPVGILAAVGDRAQTFCSYRSHATYLARTDDVEGFFLEMYGRSSGPNRGRAGSMHITNSALGHYLSSGIVAEQIPIAVGAAFAAKYNNTDKIPVVFFGDGATNEGVFWESINLACLMRLPIIFVCEDNGYAVHTSKRQRNGYDWLDRIISGFDLRVISSSSTDVDYLKQAGLEALQNAEQDIPTFIHWQCYRYLEHVGIAHDYDAGYRDRRELALWYKEDWIIERSAKLQSCGISTDTIDDMVREIELRVESAALAALEAS